MNEIPSQTIHVGSGPNKVTKLITYYFVFFFYLGLNACFLLLPKEILPQWNIFISIIVGCLLAWISTLKMWAPTDCPWKLEDHIRKPLPVFEDDPTIPHNTIVASYSPRKATWGCIVAMALIGFGIYGLSGFKNDPTIDAYDYILFTVDFLLLIASGIFMFYVKCRELRKDNPQVAINDKGIEAAGVGFYSWSQISHEHTICDGIRQPRFYYLIYDCPAGRIKINIGDYDIGYIKLGYYIKIYRGRSENKI
jgi:hypothetical protein